jgi:hypothetical protein
VHKHYTWARVEAVDGWLVGERKVMHRPGPLRAFLVSDTGSRPAAVVSRDLKERGGLGTEPQAPDF